MERGSSVSSGLRLVVLLARLSYVTAAAAAADFGPAATGLQANPLRVNRDCAPREHSHCPYRAYS